MNTRKQKQLYETIMREVLKVVKNALYENMGANDEEYTLLDTYNDNGLTYEDYVEDCKEREITPKQDCSHDFYEWLSDMNDIYWRDFQSNIIHGRNDYPVMITGKLGLWNGDHDITPVYIDGWRGDEPAILKAIKKCFGNCDDIIVKFSNGVLNVSALHHDGRNVYCIRKLSNYGME